MESKELTDFSSLPPYPQVKRCRGRPPKAKNHSNSPLPPSPQNPKTSDRSRKVRPRVQVQKRSVNISSDHSILMKNNGERLFVKSIHIDTETDIHQVKRGRGRPPKVKKPLFPGVDSQPRRDLNEPPSPNVTTEATEETVKRRRGRGRPPKAKEPPPVNADLSMAPPHSSKDGETDRPPNPVKRGRGRPPKAKEPPPLSPSPNNPLTSVEETGNVKPENAVKRGRGRPPKAKESPSPDIVMAVHIEDINSGPSIKKPKASDGEKRPRGRPKKMTPLVPVQVPFEAAQLLSLFP